MPGVNMMTVPVVTLAVAILVSVEMDSYATQNLVMWSTTVIGMHVASMMTIAENTGAYATEDMKVG